MPSLLDPAELAAALSDLPGLETVSPAQLGIRAKLPSFLTAVQLIVDVAHVAEELDHHPDVDLRWRTVIFGLSTHSAGGITELDLELARRILDLTAAAGGELHPVSTE